MNRILVDELEYKVNDNTFIIDIKSDTNIFINSALNNYIINVYDSKVNILAIINDKKSINVKFNLYSSNMVFNLITNETTKNKIEAYLYDKLSVFTMYNSVIAKENTVADINVFHKANNTKSYVYNFGVSKDNGSINFNVISKVSRKYSGCILKQDSKIISLNNTNNNIINPVLLIDNYDTEGAHAAFIGKFNEEEVFYLQSKGIKKSDAYKLLLEGFLIGVMDIDDHEKESLKEKFNIDWR